MKAHKATTKKEDDFTVKDIDNKFDMLFKDVGLNIKEHAIRKVKGFLAVFQAGLHCTQKCGFETLPFENETEFIDFLKDDPRSGLL